MSLFRFTELMQKEAAWLELHADAARSACLCQMIDHLSSVTGAGPHRARAALMYAVPDGRGDLLDFAVSQAIVFWDAAESLGVPTSLLPQ
jgi:hypothetical protein